MWNLSWKGKKIRFKDFSLSINFKTKSIFCWNSCQQSKKDIYDFSFLYLSLLTRVFACVCESMCVRMCVFVRSCVCSFLSKPQAGSNICFWLHRHIFAPICLCCLVFRSENMNLQNNRKSNKNKKCWLEKRMTGIFRMGLTRGSFLDTVKMQRTLSFR